VLTCTEPQRWLALPGPDAADSEIEAFIEHTDVCRFHDGVLREEEELLRREVTGARSVHPEGRILLTPQDRNLVERQRRQFLDWSDHPTRIKRILVRVPGKTLAELNLSRSSEIKFEVGKAPFFQVWKAGRWKRPEVLLATYPLHAFAHSSRRSDIPLANGGFLTFRVQEVAACQYECHLRCTQPATETYPASVQGRMGNGKWQKALLGFASFALVVTLVAIFVLYLRGKQAWVDRGAVEQTKQESGPEVARREDLQPSPPSFGSPGLHHEASPQDRAGTPNDIRPGHKRESKPLARDTKLPESGTPRRSSGIGKPPVSYSQVRSVYLDPAPVDFPQQLHDELSKEMAENGFTIESSRDRADARLRIITLAPSSWAFRLVNDSGVGIAVSRVRVDGEKQEELERAARQVVEALLQVTARPSGAH
jgi:hypothetical protein